MIGIGIRVAKPSDRDFVLDLAARFGPTRARWRGEDEVVDGTRRQLGNAFDTCAGDAAIFIADGQSGDRLGFAYVVTHVDFFTEQMHGHVSEIATVWDGSGAGGALLGACEAWSRQRGHRYLSLNVNDANAAARRFYERRAYLPEYRHLVKLL